MKKTVSIICAVLLIALSAFPAFAVESPQASTFSYDVEVVPTLGGSGTYNYVGGINENGEEEVHLSATPDPGYIFDHWEIKGPYRTNDSLTDANIIIFASGKITATPYFKKPGSSTVETGTVNKDGSGTSPQTGANDFIPYAVVLLSVVACGAAVLKLVKSGSK